VGYSNVNGYLRKFHHAKGLEIKLSRCSEATDDLKHELTGWLFTVMWKRDEKDY
jgi:hypothetical protein